MNNPMNQSPLCEGLGYYRANKGTKVQIRNEVQGERCSIDVRLAEQLEFPAENLRDEKCTCCERRVLSVNSPFGTIVFGSRHNLHRAA